MNQVTLLGRVTKDIELKGIVCAFTLAVTRKSKDETDFISCKAFGKTAEMLAQYVVKGQQIGIVGKIQTGSYEKEGKKIYTTDVIVYSMYFCGSNKSNDNGNDNMREAQTNVSYDNDELPF